MRLEASLQARQEMRLKLAPQIIQSIEILQLPVLELRDRIDSELLENPLLEVASVDRTDAEGTETELSELEPIEAVRAEPEGEGEPIREENYEAIEDIIRQAEDEPRDWSMRRASSGEEDGKRAAIENSPAPEQTLQEHLDRQLALFELDPTIHRICESLVANLDWRGYLDATVEEIIDSIEDETVTEEQVFEALAIVQNLEPTGVGARSTEECLLLQLDPSAPDFNFFLRLIRDNFDDILKNRYPKVARSMGCSLGELKEAVEKIGRLNPIPGALFGESAAPHVVPDLRIDLVDGEYRVMLEDSNLPSLRIAGYYARRLQEKDLDEETEAYLRDKLQGARWLIDAIQQRRSTIFNIATAIVETQTEFLSKGPMHLKPLKMQDIADRVGVHVSTVSRAIAGKYVQTPRGVFPLKHFFTGGVEKEDGELESWEVVRQKLLQVVDNEDKSSPLSDEQIAEELAKQGIEIARRTVSKYRKVLAIPSSRRRREY
jgi:RNA polymerase sigma-54 factor